MNNTFQNSTNLCCNWPEEEERAQLLFIFMQKEWVKSWRIYLKVITVYDNVKINVFGFRDNTFSYYIQRYVSNDLVYDSLLGKKDWWDKAFVEFLPSNTAGTLLVHISATGRAKILCLKVTWLVRNMLKEVKKFF
jgi:hypothetical protein